MFFLGGGTRAQKLINVVLVIIEYAALSEVIRHLSSVIDIKLQHLFISFFHLQSGSLLIYIYSNKSYQCIMATQWPWSSRPKTMGQRNTKRTKRIFQYHMILPNTEWNCVIIFMLPRCQNTQNIFKCTVAHKVGIC